MFPINDSDWIVYIQNALVRNEEPCWVDIVGNSSHPAAYYYLYPAANPNPTESAFRMRLNGDPVKNNPNEYTLKEFVWGVEIRNQSNALLFTIRVNASGNVYKLQVLNFSNVLVYNVDIMLNNPSQAGDNVRVVYAGANFPCTGPIVPDDDYFLDFRVPTSVFTGFNFATSTYRLCYFTATQDNVINKEHVCGELINPPSGVPVLTVTKTILYGNQVTCINTIEPYVLRITVYNPGTVPVNGVVLTDNLNTSIVLTTPVTFTPTAGVTFVYPTLTWNIGTVDVGETLAIDIAFAGYFTTPNHKILDSGIVTGTDLEPIPFADEGVLVYSPDQLDVTKDIISGPLTVRECSISTWTLRIRALNNGPDDIANVTVEDLLNSSFILEAPPVLNTSRGAASFNDGLITWVIDVLSGNSSETLDITVTGFFNKSGHEIFECGVAHNFCQEVVHFSDSGITVTPCTPECIVKSNGAITDCYTGEALKCVEAKVYDNSCRIVATHVFDDKYELRLSSGIYNIEFTKPGYSKKFLTLILLSDMDVIADICMQSRRIICDGIPSHETELDIYEGVVGDKIDADILFSSCFCINSRAKVECVSDIIDSLKVDTVCNSKLFAELVIEKNVVYKLDEEKKLSYDVKTVKPCYPICSKGVEYDDIKYSSRVKDSFYCKNGNRIYNMAYIRFIAYLINYSDILVRGCVGEKAEDIF